MEQKREDLKTLQRATLRIKSLGKMKKSWEILLVVGAALIRRSKGPVDNVYAVPILIMDGSNGPDPYRAITALLNGKITL